MGAQISQPTITLPAGTKLYRNQIGKSRRNDTWYTFMKENASEDYGCGFNDGRGKPRPPLGLYATKKYQHLSHNMTLQQWNKTVSECYSLEYTTTRPLKVAHVTPKTVQMWMQKADVGFKNDDGRYGNVAVQNKDGVYRRLSTLEMDEEFVTKVYRLGEGYEAVAFIGFESTEYHEFDYKQVLGQGKAWHDEITIRFQDVCDCISIDKVSSLSADDTIRKLIMRSFSGTAKWDKTIINPEEWSAWAAKTLNSKRAVSDSNRLIANFVTYIEGVADKKNLLEYKRPNEFI